jgi:hypothetical protein
VHILDVIYTFFVHDDNYTGKKKKLKRAPLEQELLNPPPPPLSVYIRRRALHNW